MAGKKVITVFGATGNQGGSVVETFLTDAKLKDDFAVRAITRDVTKDSAKKLESRGAEVVAANLDDVDSLVKALQGSYAVFAVTNYWEKLDMQIEIQQGKNIADAAKKVGIELFIFSSLDNVTKLSNGVLPHIYHFDGKAAIEDYARSIGLPSIFFLPGFYMSNFPGGMIRPSPQRNGAWTFSLPVPSTAPIPVFDTADTGKFVKAAVLHRDELLGKRLLGATRYATGDEVVDAFRRAFPAEAGKEAAYVQISHEDFKKGMTSSGAPDFVAQEMLENMRLLDEFGYYGGEPLEPTLAVVEDKLTTLEEHFKKAPQWAKLQ